jgi:hypothetical protein
MIKLQILKSEKSEKKYKAIFTKPDGKTKTVHFGSSMHQDYTQHHDKERRRLYRQRHVKDLKGDPMKAGYLSYYIFWGNSTDLQTNIRTFKKQFEFF